MTMMNNIATFADGKNLCLFFEEGDTAIYYNFENINIRNLEFKQTDEISTDIQSFGGMLEFERLNPETTISFDVASTFYSVASGPVDEIKKNIKYFKEKTISELFKEINKKINKKEE